MCVAICIQTELVQSELNRALSTTASLLAKIQQGNNPNSPTDIHGESSVVKVHDNPSKPSSPSSPDSPDKSDNAVMNITKFLSINRSKLNLSLVMWHNPPASPNSPNNPDNPDSPDEGPGGKRDLTGLYQSYIERVNGATELFLPGNYALLAQAGLLPENPSSPDSPEKEREKEKEKEVEIKKASDDKGVNPSNPSSPTRQKASQLVIIFCC